jgi:hypothetical protein
MKPIIQLHLHSDSEKAKAENLPKLAGEELKPSEEVRKRLDRIADKAAHKAAAQFGRYRSGIFSK